MAVLIQPGPLYNVLSSRSASVCSETIAVAGGSAPRRRNTAEVYDGWDGVKHPIKHHRAFLQMNLCKLKRPHSSIDSLVLPPYIHLNTLYPPATPPSVSQSQQPLNTSSLYFLIVPALSLCHHRSVWMQTHDSANMSCYEAPCRSGSHMHLLGPCGGIIASRMIFVLDLNNPAGQTAHSHEKEIFVSTFPVSLASKQTDGDMKSG